MFSLKRKKKLYFLFFLFKAAFTHRLHHTALRCNTRSNIFDYSEQKIEFNIKETHKKSCLCSHMNWRLPILTLATSTSQELCFGIIFSFHRTSSNNNEVIVLASEPNSFAYVSYINRLTFMYTERNTGS